MPKLLMLRGLPASGKSTEAKKLEESSEYKRVNKDDIRKSHDEPWSKRLEKKVVEEEDLLIETYLLEGFNVVVDDTNLNPVHEKRLRQIAIDSGATFEIRDFHTPLEECIRRDTLRAESVGEKVIRDMADKWKRYDFSPIEMNFLNASAIIVDIDGTLAGMSDRSPYDYTKVSTDFCHEDIKDLVMRMRGLYSIIVCSGRDESCRDDTIDWLRRNGIFYEELYMRKRGDDRNDAIVKREMLEEIIKDYCVDYVFDDRDRVVHMFRQSGLRVLQVAPGNF